MGFVPTAHIAIAAKRAEEQRHEEETIMYDKDDLEGWEFKIVRSVTGAFNKFETVQNLCREEAKAGWEMLEKFDDSRIRFKRRIDRRASDQNLGFDPYRTQYGIGENSFALAIIAAIAAVILLVVIIVPLMKGEGKFMTNPMNVLPFVVLAFIFLIFVARIRKRNSRK